MKLNRHFFLAALFAGSLVAPAVADPHKDESGHGRGKGRHSDREYKEEYWDGRCKVERKWEKGEYKEERKCKGGSSRSRQSDGPYYAAQPVYPAPQPGVIVERPAVVIQPQIVIRP
ncbi:hypothetical protein [Variovorax sp. EBFNA2]|uniref:hypothetical protein n=1 Tax=Variovorax sp. EBFNA2 TaxID=3342097 RepID=UPI0029C0A30C|nr:hypothetical protein [Variovorax boronicumulans]WPG35297.1 hypothetical protein RZE79_17575 [Variovorax boronicumulans]